MNPKADLSQIHSKPKSLTDIRRSINSLSSIDHTLDQIESAIAYWSDVHAFAVSLEEQIEQPCSSPEGGISCPPMLTYLVNVSRVELKKYSDLLILHKAAAQKELRFSPF